MPKTLEIGKGTLETGLTNTHKIAYLAAQAATAAHEKVTQALEIVSRAGVPTHIMTQQENGG